MAVFEIPSGKCLYNIPESGHIIRPAALLNDALYAISEFPPPRSADPAAPKRIPTSHDHQF